ncbi:hypothetical protein [Urechidicola vernalis]|uniref:Lipoprotein n=1 Tax=Urechidicola vernalis TaxID=3075600 RepID=A0ABU2Y8H2_9FLAO|nr:hypothetical protein [Urechidicola sp. P050]MDT0554156.1 hypothetical protein [Urechidicola sp. P050]
MIFKKKHTIKLIKIITLFTIGLIVFAQCKKRSAQSIKTEKESLIKKEANSEYVYLLDKQPVYRDSIYNIYISEINSDTEIIFIKSDTLSEKQRKSKFFVHVYPADKNELDEGMNFIGLDFKNNSQQFIYNGRKYFVSSTTLPYINIDKINVGQYAFNGDSSINWRIKELLKRESVLKILDVNKENIFMFDKFEEK